MIEHIYQSLDDTIQSLTTLEQALRDRRDRIPDITRVIAPWTRFVLPA